MSDTPIIKSLIRSPRYKTGRHSTNQIYNEDCLETLKRLPDKCIDMVLTSPPYDKMRNFGSFDIGGIARELKRVLVNGACIVWIVDDSTHNFDKSGTSFRHALVFKESGFNLLDTMIYQKTPRGGIGNIFKYWNNFDFMFVFSNGKPTTVNCIIDRPTKTKPTKRTLYGRRRDGGTLTQVPLKENWGKYARRTNIWYYPTGGGHDTEDDIAYSHPAIFPERLAADHILSWSREGDTVYDPFMGSGTTAKMAYLLGRRFLGSEIEKKYLDICHTRLKNYINSPDEKDAWLERHKNIKTLVTSQEKR